VHGYDLSDVAGPELPMALRRVHSSLESNALVEFDMRPPINSSRVDDVSIEDLLSGAGFSVDRAGSCATAFRCRRVHTLADSVGANMRVLLVGLNPSLHAAEVGFGFAGASNRFWPAALESGLVSCAKDPERALALDHVGMTDLVKHATARASELNSAHYRDGLGRLNRLVIWLQPTAVCVVGITGWRAAIEDKGATLGWQDTNIGSRPTLVMPNPSGLNAHTNHQDLVARFVELLAAVTV
jgi:TDG/mug DNA glycosylase family protein